MLQTALQQVKSKTGLANNICEHTWLCLLHYLSLLYYMCCNVTYLLMSVYLVLVIFPVYIFLYFLWLQFKQFTDSIGVIHNRVGSALIILTTYSFVRDPSFLCGF